MEIHSRSVSLVNMHRDHCFEKTFDFEESKVEMKSVGMKLTNNFVGIIVFVIAVFRSHVIILKGGTEESRTISHAYSFVMVEYFNYSVCPLTDIRLLITFDHRAAFAKFGFLLAATQAIFLTLDFYIVKNSLTPVDIVDYLRKFSFSKFSLCLVLIINFYGFFTLAQIPKILKKC